MLLCHCSNSVNMCGSISRRSTLIWLVINIFQVVYYYCRMRVCFLISVLMGKWYFAGFYGKVIFYTFDLRFMYFNINICAFFFLWTLKVYNRGVNHHWEILYTFSENHLFILEIWQILLFEQKSCKSFQEVIYPIVYRGWKCLNI